MDVSSQYTQGDTIETVDHDFLYPCTDEKFIYRKMGSNE